MLMRKMMVSICRQFGLEVQSTLRDYKRRSWMVSNSNFLVATSILLMAQS